MIIFNNELSEENDAERIRYRFLLKHRMLGAGVNCSVADQVKRNIEFVINDDKIYLEPYFVY